MPFSSFVPYLVLFRGSRFLLFRVVVGSITTEMIPSVSLFPVTLLLLGSVPSATVIKIPKCSGSQAHFEIQSHFVFLPLFPRHLQTVAQFITRSWPCSPSIRLRPVAHQYVYYLPFRDMRNVDLQPRRPKMAHIFDAQLDLPNSVLGRINLVLLRSAPRTCFSFHLFTPVEAGTR